ncbi:sulfate reduction electron transfer complex DsrMKJOP subunit DsrJ [Desulfosporosinus sp. FKB]|uniref:sulfate reduction electron transfer complex DsrMKJOP subunit DsrJ n=1 Tax=Desulfosporosinus sp. FKB TaxID=1969835 RepID=UPI000B4A34A6|nr:sulfate reduction electron transfer complex DsrMKJOP subunit DsrJ [Desulfosporosinus sp. FKB]
MIYSKKIYLGILIFIILLISPFLASLGKANVPPVPSLDTPVINAMTVKQCVEPTEYMKDYHMQLLYKWRDEYVREGNTIYVNSRGQKYTISFEKTCLKCHSNEEQFCQRCHTYAGVKLYCWECHQK